MRPGSTDSILTVFASLLVAVLLFAGRHVIDGRGTSVRQPPSESDGKIGQTLPPQTSDPWGSAEPDDVVQTLPSGDDVFGERPAGPPVTAELPATDAYKVIAVIDGDTVDILVDRKPLRLRLNGIDTPEKGQPFGSTAKEGLAKLVAGKAVRYAVRDTDRYDRSIADLYVGDVHVNLWLVQQGLAWHYVAYSSDPQLAAAEAEAKAGHRGLWSDPRRVAPWNWRKLSKIERDDYR